MLAALILLFIGIVFSTIFIVKRNPNPTVMDVMRKTLASSVFVILAMFSICLSQDISIIICLLFAIGSLFGLFGDIWLDLKGVHTEESDTLLRCGFLFFGAEQILYTIGIFKEAGIQEISPISATILIAIAFALGAWLLEKPLSLNYGRHRIDVIIYSAVLSALCSSSLWALLSAPTLSHVIRFIGVILFLASDGILCLTYFGENKNTKTMVVLNHASYYAAQFLIVLSLYF